MVAKILVERDIEAGKLLVAELVRSNVPISAALWLYEAEDDRYQLVIASELYKTGPLETLEKIQEALLRLADEKRVELTDIKVVSPENPIVQAVRRTIKTGPGAGGIRFSRNTINGVYIQDAWIYKST